MTKKREPIDTLIDAHVWMARRSANGMDDLMINDPRGSPKPAVKVGRQRCSARRMSRSRRACWGSQVTGLDGQQAWA
jgi:hypothetical protein